MLSHHTVYQISRKIRFWVNKNILTPVTYVLFKDFLWETHTAGLQVSKRKILITNKQSVKQLLQRRLLHDHLLIKVKHRKLCLNPFYSNRNNELMRVKLFFLLFSSRCFTKVATYFKSYWMHYKSSPRWKIRSLKHQDSWSWTTQQCNWL